MTSLTSPHQTPDVPADLAEALIVDGPAPGHEAELAFFAQLVGSWRLAWAGTGTDGVDATSVGELHVGWILGGRAVQDVWIVPGRAEPGEGSAPFAFHGSTIRFFDRRLGAWRSTWVDPLGGRLRRFIGRPDGPEGRDLLLLSDEDDPQLRWHITDVRQDAFVWSAETSLDGGATWTWDERMDATRLP